MILLLAFVELFTFHFNGIIEFFYILLCSISYRHIIQCTQFIPTPQLNDTWFGRYSSQILSGRISMSERQRPGHSLTTMSFMSGLWISHLRTFTELSWSLSSIVIVVYFCLFIWKSKMWPSTRLCMLWSCSPPLLVRSDNYSHQTPDLWSAAEMVSFWQVYPPLRELWSFGFTKGKEKEIFISSAVLQ